ncbi:MAG TPA: hypothetical protein VJH71_01380 [Candidatus Paceibacterota bacterium]
MNKFLIFLAIILLTVIPMFKAEALALPVQSGLPSSGPVPSSSGSVQLPGEDLTIQDVFSIVTGLTCWFARAASVLMVIMIMIASIRFSIAKGDTAGRIAAMKNFKHVFIGLLVIMGVYVIIATVAKAVGADFSLIPLFC